jgi:undecaprenyl-diphosphatase
VQYAGDLPPLAAALASRGWTAAPDVGWAAWVQMLATDLPMEKLPVLPQVHSGRHESLALTKPAPDGRRLVLRLWPAWHTLEPTGTPLWIGTASLQELRAPAGMLVFAATTDRFAEALTDLSGDLRDLETRRPDPARDLLLAREPDRPHPAP